MMTDPIADMLTRVRNANRTEAPAVDMPSTHMKTRIAQVLKEEGFILDFQVGRMAIGAEGRAAFQSPADENDPKKVLRIFLKYGPEGERVIRHIERRSRPGLRLYKSHKELAPVLDGLGISILSTSKVIMSARQPRARRLGG